MAELEVEQRDITASELLEVVKRVSGWDKKHPEKYVLWNARARRLELSNFNVKGRVEIPSNNFGRVTFMNCRFMEGMAVSSGPSTILKFLNCTFSKVSAFNCQSSTLHFFSCSILVVDVNVFKSATLSIQGSDVQSCKVKNAQHASLFFDHSTFRIELRLTNISTFDAAISIAGRSSPRLKPNLIETLTLENVSSSLQVKNINIRRVVITNQTVREEDVWRFTHCNVEFLGFDEFINHGLVRFSRLLMNCKVPKFEEL